MRCKKCGWISFDWLENCGKCGKSMEDERLLIGAFIPDKEPVNWYELETQSASATPKETSPLSNIDVSDLTGENSGQGEEIGLEEVELERIAENEDFQKALEKIAG